MINKFFLLILIKLKKYYKSITYFVLFLMIIFIVLYYVEINSVKSGVRILEPKMIKILGGSFLMGTTQAEINSIKTNGDESLVKLKEKIKDETNQRPIALKDFEVSQTEVTKGQFRQFVHESKTVINNKCFNYGSSRGSLLSINWENPGFDQTDNHPVTCITWKEAQEYIKWLNQNTSKNYRLLSEAEWEYVAKAGCTSQYNIAGQCKEKIEPSQANFDGRIQFNGSQISDLKRVGTQAVGSYQPNQMNVFDMHGNIAEFVQDCYELNYSKQPTDGSAHRAVGCNFVRVYRGGSWNDAPSRLRANYRGSGYNSTNTLGFRIARSLP
jgi:formylglycine-generating enzyme required for sulfatase activity